MAYNKNAQCHHEVRIYLQFKRDLFSQRWLNNETYNLLTPETDVFWNNDNILGVGSRVITKDDDDNLTNLGSRRIVPLNTGAVENNSTTMPLKTGSSENNTVINETVNEIESINK